MHLYWDKHNPWRDRAVYLPDLKELSACINPFAPEDPYNRWVHFHHLMVDAYILRAESGFHNVGVRYGAEGHMYYSPHVNRYISSLLLLKYQPIPY